MSFRSIEMQIAIPRTNEIGNVQNHLMQKPTYDQAALAAETRRQKERERKRSEKIDGASAPLIRDDRQGGGRHIDISI